MRKFVKTTAAVSALAAFGVATPAQAGSDAYLGEIMMTAASFCPRGTAELNGQLLSIAQNDALFSLMGTYYGGNGTTTFALPDLRGRVPMHYGQGNGLTPYMMGQQGGQERVTLTQQGMPSHTDDVMLPGTVVNNPAGGNNMQPFLVFRYCIHTAGIYPARN